MELHTQNLFIKQNPFSPHSLVWLHGSPIWHCAGISGVVVGGEKQLQMPFQQMPIPQPPHCSSLEHITPSLQRLEDRGGGGGTVVDLLILQAHLPKRSLG